MITPPSSNHNSRVTSRSPDAFYALVRQEAVTVLNQTPSAFAQFVHADTATSAPPALSLRVIILGGEALSPLTLMPWFARHGDRSPQVINMYGITETTIHVTYHPLTSADLSPAIGTVIGTPIPDLQVYLLDERLQLVPIGVPGEIYVGGAGLARGYLNRPALTAERFIPHPFSNEPGARLYKTGDLARYRSDGHIEYLGRRDHQVKLRGYRIELGEIEAALARHPGVREAVVIARADTPGDQRLIAYIVGDQAPAPQTVDLRRFLKETLPAYMLPAAIVPLDALPLTPNGKLDRAALPAPDHTRPRGGDASVPPRTPLEELLAAIWADILGVPRVGAHDDFFALGGHSLLATQVVSRIRERLHVEVALRALFEAPTVGELAGRIEALDDQTRNPLPALRPGARNGVDVLSFAQQRLWFLDQFEPGSAAYAVPIALRLSGTLDVAAIEQSLSTIVRRHDAFRTTFTTTPGGEPIQVVAAADTALPLVDLQGHSASTREDTARRLIEAEAARPFDLRQGPLVRARLLRLAPDEHILLLTIHHIVIDGWSIGVLTRELTALYTAFAQGQASLLPPLPIQYADVAAWQRAWLTGERLAEQLAYWRARLANAPVVLDLPTDRPRPPVQTFAGASHTRALPRPLYNSLLDLGKREGVTLFMTLLAAFQTLLAAYSGQDDIVVGSPIAGRTHAETEPLIGLFVNTLVLRGDLSGNPTVRELLARVREMALSAYTHQDLPFEKLVEDLQPPRDRSRNPLVQVLFVLQNTPRVDLDLPGLTVRPLEVVTGTAKVDLTLSAIETPEGLYAHVGYNTDLFDAATIERLTRDFQAILHAMAADPTRRLSTLPLPWRDTHDHHTSPALSGPLYRPDAGAAALLPNNPLHYQLQRLWEDLLGVRPTNITDDFFDLGGHSLLAVRLVADIERMCGKQLPLATLFEGTTIAHLTRALLRDEGADPDARHPAVIEVQAGGTRKPFFFLHGDFHGGGLYCRDVARRLGADQPFYTLPPQGLDGQVMRPTIEAIAAYHVAALRAVQPEGPYLLGGFCIGGLVAFEMARQLRAHGQRVDLVAMIHTTVVNTQYREVYRLQDRLRALTGPDADPLFGLVLRLPGYTNRLRRLLSLPLADQINRVAHKARRSVIRAAGGRRGGDTRAQSGQRRPEHEENILPVSRRDELMYRYGRAAAHYIPRPYAGRTALLWPSDEPALPRHDPFARWRHISPLIDVRVVPGEHLTCITTHAEALAAHLRACLDDAHVEEAT